MATKKFDTLFGLTSGITPERDEEKEHQKTRSAPGQMMGLSTQRDDALDRAEKAEAAIKELEARLRQEQNQKGFLELDLDLLHKVPGRQRVLMPEERAQLKANLRQHKLATPITVELRPDGGYNIVSGSNRVDLYRELHAEFGDKPKIKACLVESEPDVVEDLSFFANLLHSSLPAYEKYVGLKKMHARSIGSGKQLTHDELADLTGITRSTVTDLFKFEALPAEALEMLKSKPSALGSKGAAALAAIKGKAGVKRIVEAVRKLINEDIKEVDAIKFATEGLPENTTKANRPEPFAIRSGRSIFCTVLGVKKTLRVDFTNEDDRVEAESALKDILDKQAKRRNEEKG